MRALEVGALHAGYGSAEVLFGVDLAVGESEVLAMLGRNGMGKSTLIRAVLGLTAVSAGTVQVAGVNVTGWPSHRIARAGVGWVPEGRQIFSTLTIEENLLVSARKNGPWTLQKIYGLFPRLEERKHHFGSQISGGEQQMLAVGRALLTQPTILILDEATEGLAPLIRGEIWTCIARLKAEGQAILLVDKHLGQLVKLADRHVIIEKGQVVWSGTSAALAADRTIVQRYLQV